MRRAEAIKFRHTAVSNRPAASGVCQLDVYDPCQVSDSGTDLVRLKTHDVFAGSRFLKVRLVGYAARTTLARGLLLGDATLSDMVATTNVSTTKQISRSISR